MLASVISDELAKHPVEQHASEPFAQKVQELQQTLKLTDFETEVLLVLAFVGSNLLYYSGDRNCNQEEKKEFVAKCLN